ncbi:MAG: winged helix-turn-helix domain-containing protein [Candidatus Bathyarchaeia archaeon]
MSKILVEYEMVNRDRHDIVFEILKKAASGKRKTEIMREVGLSYAQSKQYLNVLLQKGLLEIENDKFKTTDKGLKFMDKCADCLLSQWNKQRKRQQKL